MNTVLIAEDEKLLRAGLRTMVSRSGVPYTEILEARDGQEALETLKSRQVDLLITDIRMPKMDGIELVSRIRDELDYSPAVLVVSGYDDFSYAVEMLRNGAQDYLLKPVERERLYNAIRKVEEQIVERNAEKEAREREYLDTLRQLMMEPDAKGDEWRERLARYGGDFFSGPYVGFCSGEAGVVMPDSVLKIRAVGSVIFYASPESGANSLEGKLTLPIGKSRVHRGLEALHLAYREAQDAWKVSFFTGDLRMPRESSYKPLNVTAEQLAGLIGLSKWQDASRLLRSESVRVAHGEADPEEYARLCGRFMEQLEKTYPELMVDSNGKFDDLWSFDTINRYLRELEKWLEELCVRTSAAFSDFENRQKIRQAVQYVQAHFREPLNMAEVSNRVSMNYSLFSTLFKQYTGVNFVNYLQNLRIEETKRLLETTDWRVSEIGRRSGFTDDKHFLKTFKSVTGFSPTEYRKSRLLLERKDGEDG